MKYRYHLGGRSYESAQTRVAAVLLAPTLLALVALYLIPIARVLVLSFTSTNTITNRAKKLSLSLWQRGVFKIPRQYLCVYLF